MAAAAAGMAMALTMSAADTAQAANQPPATTTITLIGSNAVLGITDSGQAGPTPGDSRAMWARP